MSFNGREWMGGAVMRSFLISIIAFATIPSALGQSSSQNYQRGTILTVAHHVSAPSENNGDLVQYDVSIKVGNIVYQVLYTPPDGASSVEFAAGLDLLVSVGDNTLTFPSKLTGTTEVPILHRETLPSQTGIDWSKAPSQYFEMKMRNLSEALDLTDQQQVKLKPIAEQEAAEAGQVCFTSVIPREERLKRWGEIVRSSDEKMRSFLSSDQWKKLQELRREQKKELKQVIGQADTKD
jgi:hypothetical protein